MIIIESQRVQSHKYLHMLSLENLYFIFKKRSFSGVFQVQFLHTIFL